MDQLKVCRRVLRAAFTRAATKLEQLLAQVSEEDTQNVQVYSDVLNEKYEELRACDNKIFSLLMEANATEEDLSAEVESTEAYTVKYKVLRVGVGNVQRSASEAASSGSSGRQSSENQVPVAQVSKFKYPTIEFKKYGGTVKDWLHFWGQFKKIDEDPALSNEDKYQYLIQATIPNSRAREVIESFPPVGENYAKALDSLKSRFGRKDLQIEVYVRELLRLVLNNAMSSTKPAISTLYDKIETQLRALETLGIVADDCAAMLFPLIESCLPEELLRAWQRSSDYRDSGNENLRNRLTCLMKFIRNEVENEERICMAVEGFGISGGSDRAKRIKQKAETNVATASGLMNCESDKCIFCVGQHDANNCFKAQKMSLDEKKTIVNDKRACFRCLRPGHLSRKCRERLNCVLCTGPHNILLCPNLPLHKNSEPKADKPKSELASNTNVKMEDKSLSNQTSTQVLLQTVRVRMRGDFGTKVVRAVFDTGSQRSYVLESTAAELGYPVKSTKTVIHSLFGGSTTTQVLHNCFDIRLTSMDNKYRCTFEVMDQPVICNDIAPVRVEPWGDELRLKKIKLTDVCEPGAIELLIGADVAGKLYSGRKHVLKSGLVAIHTHLGWTVMGKVPCVEPSENSLTGISLLEQNASLAELWELDTLGIKDPVEKITRTEMESASKNYFLQTVTINDECRYEVRLPWVADHPPVPTNYGLAKKRLDTTVKKLEGQNLYQTYHDIFIDWESDGIIERVDDSESFSQVHYMPHRPVIKTSSMTTKVRPVFDASAREKDKPSLNQCLEKGSNLIELIPSIILKFRKEKYGVVSDISKAFLQISVHESDRDFLRFLWRTPEGQDVIYRHRRVVFGLSSSPFLLGATIDYHLSKCLELSDAPDSLYAAATVRKLQGSFYVDNCVTSVSTDDSLEQFIRESTLLMNDGNFDLRGWEFSGGTDECRTSIVLGLVWNPYRDTLKINGNWSKDLETEIITKRVILSIAQRVYDPIGFACPALLLPKLLLQGLWKSKVGWDTAVDSETENLFLRWYTDLKCLTDIEIPRWIQGIQSKDRVLSLHTFCDASKESYAAAVFLRVEDFNSVHVHLVQAKARVAPLKEMTIPRLELLAATIGARLWSSVNNDFEPGLPCYFWSDSTTVLSWIDRAEQWAPFVRNRVLEIRELTFAGSWRHIPGTMNPADLPSRGCMPRQLKDGAWWEGPKWLYDPPALWPQTEIVCDEAEILSEKRKTLIASMLTHERDNWYYAHFSKYNQIVRLVAWIQRFMYNMKNPTSKRIGELTCTDFDKAESFVLKDIQTACFCGPDDKRLSSLNAFLEEDGLIRLKTRISRRQDSRDFRYPIVLPAKHPVVERLIFSTHVNSCHVGVQSLLCLLRERYWILGGRRTIRSAISKCVICKRYASKPLECVMPPLPTDRVRDAVAFEITGIDLAGPLYLKGSEKVWFCLFTCGVYRAIHLELLSSLSTSCFLQALRRFVARRGRPRVVYSDNGTNFVGAENAFKQLD